MPLEFRIVYSLNIFFTFNNPSCDNVLLSTIALVALGD
jgi:hypothetical protein